MGTLDRGMALQSTVDLRRDRSQLDIWDRAEQ
jgi:hypothetical protein